LRFKKRASRGSNQMSCTNCKSNAERELPTSFSASVEVATEGTNPQNTGSSLDYDYDTLIALDSKKRWEAVHERNMAKEQVLRDNPNADRGSLSQNTDGSYRVMGDDERGLKDKVRESHNQFVKDHLQSRKPR